MGGAARERRPAAAAGAALLGLWRVQFQSLRRHLATTLEPAKLHNEVTLDVHRADRLIENGLTSSWPS
ncbi:hypothetical protein GCM10027610_034550 [Dactylosporangium cerinum]